MISSRGMPPYWATQLCAALKFVFLNCFGLKLGIDFNYFGMK